MKTIIHNIENKDVENTTKDLNIEKMADLSIPATIPDTRKKYEDVHTGDWAKLAKFKDGAKTSAYAQPAMQWAVSVDIISGKGNGVLDPKGKATLAEVAAVLTRFVEYLTQ